MTVVGLWIVRYLVYILLIIENFIFKDDQSVSQVPQFESGTRPRMGRQKSVINYVSNEQKRWKSTVQEQRRNIYDKHTMLN